MMGLREFCNKFKNKKGVATPSDVAVLKSWYKDRYESAVVQRNILFVLMSFALVVIAMSVFVIRYVRSTKSIEPFIIEIERKTGVPTVVDPVSVAAYSANTSVKRYFVWRYIMAREEYFPSTYNYNYTTVVRVLSTSDVYFSDYRSKFSMANPISPYNIYAQGSTRIVKLKSMIFTDDSSAQVRISMNVSGVMNMKMDKIVFIEFDFQNIEMNDEERLINPLGFRVKLYRIEDERTQ